AGLAVAGTAKLAITRTWLAVAGTGLAILRQVVGRLRVRRLDGVAGLRRLSFVMTELRVIRARA
ncbi:MAG TPA: hypothetical protein VN961_17380, partial [Streptosporangiaceae bacterium]|nr:hypothetical protein [Streptosporangiaceae bacterium]